MADNDLTALLARLKELPAGLDLLVLIPTGEPQTVGGLVLRTNETYHIPGALFAAPAVQPDPDAPRSVTALRDLNVRAEPVMTAALLGTVAAGTSVLAFDVVENNYRRVQYNGAAAWVLTSGLA